MTFGLPAAKPARIALLLALVGLPLAVQAGGDGLLVFAAASLKNALDGVVTAYESDHDIDVEVSYAGSSTLARQIQLGAPAQLYICANQAWMDKLAGDGLIEINSRTALLRNSLVLVAPANRGTKIKIAPGFDIVAALGQAPLAMANTDAVPAGIYGRQALQHLGVWKSLRGRIAQASDVRAALALVARGESQLGIVYASDAVAQTNVRVVDHFADDIHDPIIYPAAIVAGVNNPQAAAFLTFLQSPTAVAIFRQWGFQPAGDD